MTMPRVSNWRRKTPSIMHPGPIIRGLELTWEVADCPQSAIVEEVQNGVPTRMAILARALGKAMKSRNFYPAEVRGRPRVETRGADGKD